MKMTMLRPLQFRTFRYLWAGQVVSDLGDWLDFLALIALLVYRWDLGPGSLALLSITVALPRVVLGPFAGVWVDRADKKLVMIVADLGRAIVVLNLLWVDNLPVLLVVVFLKGVFSSFFSPARQVMIRSTIPDENLLAANSLSHLSVQSGKVLGPAMGGVLVAAFGPRVCFAIDAGTFLLSAAFLSRLPSGRPAAEEMDRPKKVDKPRFLDEFREGIGYIRARRTLTVAIGGMSAALFMAFMIDSLGVLALKSLGFGEGLFGFAVGSIGLGTAVGAVVIGQSGSRFNPFRILGTGLTLTGCVVAILGFAVLTETRGTGVYWLFVYFLFGLAAAAVLVPYAFVIQIETPQRLLGRVSAVSDGFQTAFQLMAPPIGAAIAEVWGVGWVFAGAGSVLGLIGIILFLFRPEMGRPAGAGEPESAIA